MSKLLTDNIDTFLGIAKGKKWQIRPPVQYVWEVANEPTCPLRAVLNGYEIRLAPEKKWVDFSCAPEKRPKMAMLSIKRNLPPDICILIYSPELLIWQFQKHSYEYSDYELFINYNWHHEDGTVTPFGVEVEE